MKFFRTFIIFVIVISLLLFSSVVVFANGTLIKEWKGQDLLDRNGDAGKEGNVRTMRYGVNTSFHPIWGAETDPIGTDNQPFTIVIEAKIAEDDGSTPDDAVVFRIDPKVRVVNESGDIIDEPIDQPYPITAEQMREAKKDGEGFSKFYYLMQPAVYGNADIVKIENRINYEGNTGAGNLNRIGIDIRSIAIYQGDALPDDGIIGDPAEDPNGTTGDKNVAYMVRFLLIAVVAGGCSIYLMKKKKV